MAEKMIATLKTMLAELQKIITIRAAIGEPIEIEDKILIPIFRVSAGIGGGGPAEVYGFGSGGGVTPVAVLAIFKGVPGPEGVKVLIVKTPSTIAQVIGEVAPLIMEKLMPPKGELIPEEKKQKLKEI